MSNESLGFYLFDSMVAKVLKTSKNLNVIKETLMSENSQVEYLCICV